MTCCSCLFLFVPKRTRNKASLVLFLLETTLYKPCFELVNREPRTNQSRFHYLCIGVCFLCFSFNRMLNQYPKRTLILSKVLKHWENFLSLTLCSSITKTYIYQKYSPTQRNVAFCLHWNLFWLTMTSLAESFNTFLKYSIVQKRTKREIIIPMESTLCLSPFFICMFC